MKLKGKGGPDTISFTFRFWRRDTNQHIRCFLKLLIIALFCENCMEKYKFIYDDNRVHKKKFFPVLLFLSLILIVHQAHSALPLHASFSGFTDPLGVLQNYSSATMAGSSQQPDTLHFLALRVEFVKDELATTTGDGQFDMSVDNDYLIDKPPHNRTYFQRQLLALSNYFFKVSNSKLVLQSKVLPEDETGVYRLNENMVYYSGQESEELKQQRWAELLRDVVLLAKEQDNPDFSQYDAVIIFHAGVGSDFAFDFDPTPYDIQSVFLDFESLKETLGKDIPDYRGIQAGDNIFIREGIILPEMQNQEEQVLGLLGTMTLLVGSQLGMPSLFDTETGRAGIGRWGLMDQGSYNFQGLIPAEPCAWTKVYMGWEQPVVVTNGKDLKVGTSQTQSAPHIYKIPITAKEYFLIENRQKDRNRDGVTFGRNISGARAQFDTLGSVVTEKDFGVITSIDEYDFGLPGSGLLIWHIDENVIDANLLSNTINNDRDLRGVDLVECDGAQDIGYYYGMFEPGSGTESGDFFDPYWAGNISHKIVNEDADTVAFSPKTVPNSNANDGSVTFINIYDIGARDSVMTFSVNTGMAQPGFPQYAGTDFYAASLKAIQINGGAETGFVALAGNGNLVGWNSKGQAILPQPPGQSPDEITEKNKLASLDDRFSLPPAAADLTGDGNDEVIIAGQSGLLYVLQLADSNSDGRADVLDSLNIGSTPTAGPLIFKQDNSVFILVGTEAGDIQIFRYDTAGIVKVNQVDVQNGQITGLAGGTEEFPGVYAVTGNGYYVYLNSAFGTEQSAALEGFDTPDVKIFAALADFDGSAGPEPVFFSGNGRIYGNTPTDRLVSGPDDYAAAVPYSAPAIGQLNNDGLPDIVFHYDEFLYGSTFKGINTLNFPVKVSEISGTDREKPAPVFLYDNVEGPVLFSATPDGQLLALNGKGRLLSGFPLNAGRSISVTPALADLDNDGDAECAVISGDGYIYVWDLPYSADLTKSWSQYGADRHNSFLLPGENTIKISETELMPGKSVFCYPNPVENGPTHIRYKLKKDVSRVTVRIYDIAGDLVEEINANGTSTGENEVTWDISGIQSGAYIARVEAQGGDETAVEFIKIAVVK